MLNPYTKQKFQTSIYKGEKFHDKAYDQNDKFSVHLQVEEDKYLQKLQAMARASKPDNSKKEMDTQVDQFELANQAFEDQKANQARMAQTAQAKPQAANAAPQDPRVVKTAQFAHRKRFGKTMSDRMRPLGPWYYEKYQVK